MTSKDGRGRAALSESTIERILRRSAYVAGAGFAHCWSGGPEDEPEP